MAQDLEDVFDWALRQDLDFTTKEELALATIATVNRKDLCEFTRTCALSVINRAGCRVNVTLNLTFTGDVEMCKSSRVSVRNLENGEARELQMQLPVSLWELPYDANLNIKSIVYYHDTDTRRKRERTCILETPTAERFSPSLHTLKLREIIVVVHGPPSWALEIVSDEHSDDGDD